MKNFSYLLISILVFFQSASLEAERVKVSNLHHLNNAIHKAKSNFDLQKFTNRFQVYINGIGRVTFRFNDVELSKVQPVVITDDSKYVDRSTVVLMKGWAFLNNKPFRAAATLSTKAENSTLDLSFLFNQSESESRKNAIYQLKISDLAHKPKPILERTLPVHFKDKTCGTKPLLAHYSQQFSHARHAAPGNRNAPGSLKELEVSAHVDASYVALHGSGTSNIQARLNEAAAFYENDLGISYKIIRILVDNSLNFSSGETSDMLEDFASYISSNGYRSTADVFHLFTAIDLQSSGNSSPVGVAYQGLVGDTGVVCRPDLFFNFFGIRPATVGITERRSFATNGQVSVTIAHEIGHNFSAEHSASGIMAASLSSNLPDSFSDASKTTILDYVSEHGSCLSTVEDPDPSPTPTPDPDGSEGDGSGSDDDNPNAVQVNIEANLDRSGNFIANLSLNEAPASSCNFELRMGTKKRKVSFSTLLVSTPATSISESFQTNISSKARRKNRRGKVVKIWLMGVLSCQDASSGSSSLVRIKAHRIRTRRRQGAKKWINSLKNQLSPS